MASWVYSHGVLKNHMSQKRAHVSLRFCGNLGYKQHLKGYIKCFICILSGGTNTARVANKFSISHVYSCVS